MNISPTLRWLLTGLAAGATAAVSILADGFQPLDAILILIPVLAGLGIVPPQTGGTQQGVVNPSLSSPPPVDTGDPYTGPDRRHTPPTGPEVPVDPARRVGRR